MRIRMSVVFLTLLWSICFVQGQASSAPISSWEFTDGNFHFVWNLETDNAQLSLTDKSGAIWRGSLLPSFWLQDSSGKQYVHPTVALTNSTITTKELSLNILVGSWGTGTLHIEKDQWGIRMTEFKVEWNHRPCSIIEMYIGTSSPAAGAENIPSTWERPFMPDWQAAGYCIPGAKEGTAQSYFRNWDFGHANIALGNFGPSMGIPYAAAFPRPMLFAALGSDKGWISMGSGCLPDAPLSLKIQSTRGCFQYLYREDKWGTPAGTTRIWTDLLRITYDQSAYGAFQKYFASFPIPAIAADVAPSPFWNTWGMWRNGKYELQPLTDFAKQLGNQMLVMDDGWESSQGSGQPFTRRFPNFAQELSLIKEEKMQVGFWETLAWIGDTAAAGMEARDLISDQNGRPIKTNWSFDPDGKSYYCLDISSHHAREYLISRTRKMMQDLKPGLIKLDFGYTMPNPDMGVPRDPVIRGERYSYELIKLISDAAKSINPHVVVIYYCISPLYLPAFDLVSLDDQGDLWYDVKKGHQEWSIWASLVSNRAYISGSSTYEWKDDNEVLFNSIILGVPGASLPLTLTNGSCVPDEYQNRRLAVNSWYRKSKIWRPNWFNSYLGGLESPPVLRCWGREEWIAGKWALSALALRDGQDSEDVRKIHWVGNWVLVAQDEKDISVSGILAVIPFSAGKISIPLKQKPLNCIRKNTSGESECKNWTWSQGILTITVSENLFRNTAGFLIHINKD